MVFRWSDNLKAERAVFPSCKSVAAISDDVAAISNLFEFLTLGKSRLINGVLPVSPEEFKNKYFP
jgi:hypothetical protein